MRMEVKKRSELNHYQSGISRAVDLGEKNLDESWPRRGGLEELTSYNKYLQPSVQALVISKLSALFYKHKG